MHALTAPVTSIAGFGRVAVTTLESLEAEEFARAARLKDTFQEFAREHRVSDDPGAGERGSVMANWPIDEPVLVQTLGERGRVFDLIVVGRSGEALKVPDTPVMESALFDSGRPVLIAPKAPPKSIVNAVLNAWNGAAESARAVAFALPCEAPQSNPTHVFGNWPAGGLRIDRQT